VSYDSLISLNESGYMDHTTLLSSVNDQIFKDIIIHDDVTLFNIFLFAYWSFYFYRIRNDAIYYPNPTDVSSGHFCKMSWSP